MKNIISILFAVAFLFSCSSDKGDVKVTIENPSDFDRLAELVEIPIDTIKGKLPLSDSMVYVVKTESGEVIPSQVTYDRKIIFQPELKAGEAKSFVITTGEPQEFPAKTYGRFITERKDDFAWENDRVVFRAYGPSLVEIDGPSNGFDAWYKKTNNLVIDKWYKNDLAGVQSYHEDHGEGLDDYSVGRSLGAGAMAPYVNGKLWLNDNFATQEVLENGPLRTTFKLNYNDLDVDGKKIAENRTISIDAGSQLSKVVQAYTIKEPMDVAAGIAKREKGDSIITSVDKGYLIYSEPKTSKSDGVYLGLLFPQGLKETKIDIYENFNPVKKQKGMFSHILGITTQQPRIPVTYYTGYGWKEYGFSGVNDFEKYMQNFATSLQQPFKVIYPK